jgi:serine/threonine protein kinase
LWLREGIAESPLKALRYVHSMGIVHRDVKLSNILFDRSKKKAVLIDFGLAKQLCESNPCYKPRGEGTKGYLAPEVREEDEECGTAVDIWGLGVVLAGLVRSEKHTRELGAYRMQLLAMQADDLVMDALARVLEKCSTGMTMDALSRSDFKGFDRCLRTRGICRSTVCRLDEKQIRSILGAVSRATSEEKELIGRMLCPCHKRITAEEALGHRFLALHAARQKLCGSPAQHGSGRVAVEI